MGVLGSVHISGHETQVVTIAMQHSFNHNTRLLSSDPSIFYSPVDKTGPPAPETKSFAGPQACSRNANT